MSSRPAGGLPAREVCFGARCGDCLPDQRLPAPQSHPGSTRRPPASPLLQCAWNEGLSLQEVSLSPREDVFLPWSPEPCPFGPSQPHEKDGWLRSVHLEVGQVRQVRKAEWAARGGDRRQPRAVGSGAGEAVRPLVEKSKRRSEQHPAMPSRPPSAPRERPGALPQRGRQRRLERMREPRSSKPSCGSAHLLRYAEWIER